MRWETKSDVFEGTGMRSKLKWPREGERWFKCNFILLLLLLRYPSMRQWLNLNHRPPRHTELPQMVDFLRESSGQIILENRHLPPGIGHRILVAMKRVAGWAMMAA